MEKRDPGEVHTGTVQVGVGSSLERKSSFQSFSAGRSEKFPRCGSALVLAHHNLFCLPSRAREVVWGRRLSSKQPRRFRRGHLAGEGKESGATGRATEPANGPSKRLCGLRARRAKQESPSVQRQRLRSGAMRIWNRSEDGEDGHRRCAS